MSRAPSRFKYEEVDAKQVAKIRWLRDHGYEVSAICERFSITREWYYHIVGARGPGRCSSRGNGLGLRSSLADGGRDSTDYAKHPTEHGSRSD